MHLKLFVLSASSVVLWLAPLTALDKTLNIHKALQGVSLTAAFACAVTAGNIARKLSEQGEIEAIKERAITADVIDEISTSAYISQQQRQQEAELILTSPGVDVEASRKVLEAIYSNDLQDSASRNEHPDYSIYLEVCKSREAGKSTTWIVENILKMGGRKFSDGKVKLQTLLNQFEEEGK
jgi:flagellar motility protein MotE (MotC chaperone)